MIAHLFSERLLTLYISGYQVILSPRNSNGHLKSYYLVSLISFSNCYVGHIILSFISELKSWLCFKYCFCPKCISHPFLLFDVYSLCKCEYLTFLSLKFKSVAYTDYLSVSIHHPTYVCFTFSYMPFITDYRWHILYEKTIIFLLSPSCSQSAHRNCFWMNIDFLYKGH